MILIAAAGFAAAIYGHLPLVRTGWIIWTIVLFSFSGVVFSLRVAPLQKQLRAVAEAGTVGNGFDFERYRALARRWEIWGGVALFAPLVGLALMVLKPVA